MLGTESWNCPCSIDLLVEVKEVLIGEGMQVSRERQMEEREGEF